MSSRSASARSTRSAASTASTPSSATATASGRWSTPAGLPQTGQGAHLGRRRRRHRQGRRARHRRRLRRRRVSPNWRSGGEEGPKAEAKAQPAAKAPQRGKFGSIDVWRGQLEAGLSSPIATSRRAAAPGGEAQLGCRPASCAPRRVDSAAVRDHDAGVKRLLGYLRRYRGRYAAGGACLLVTATLAMAVPYLLKRAVDTIAARRPVQRRSPARGGDRRDRARAGGGAHAARASLIFNVGRDVEYDLRNDLFAHLAAPAARLLPAAADRRPDVAAGQRHHRGPHAARRRHPQPRQHARSTTSTASRSCCSIDWRLTLAALLPYPLAAARREAHQPPADGADAARAGGARRA